MEQDIHFIQEALISTKESAELISNAILNLIPKGIDRPIFTAIIAAIIGAVSSFLGVKYGAKVTYNTQQRVEIQKQERKDIGASNLLILKIMDAHDNLISVKNNYVSLRERNPLLRAYMVPNIMGHFQSIDFELINLHFIIKKISGSEEYPYWQQIRYINCLIENFNLLQKLWSRRNVVYDILSSNFSEGTDVNEVLTIAPNEYKELVHLTEFAVKLTDELILVIISFLKNFPEIAEKHFSSDALKISGPIIKFATPENEEYQKALEKITAVDKEELCKFIGRTEEQWDQTVRTGYENFKV